MKKLLVLALISAFTYSACNNRNLENNSPTEFSKAETSSEAIIFGNDATAKESQVEQIAESKLATNNQKLDENSYSATTKRVKIKWTNDPFADLTYLTRLMAGYKASPTCQQISTLKGKDNYSYSPDLLDSDELKSKVKEVLKDEEAALIFLKELKENILKPNDIEMVDAICIKNNVIYITLLKYINNSESMFLTTWNNTEQKFMLSKPLGGLWDFAYLIEPAAINGKHLILSHYGDMGIYRWRFYLLDQLSGELDQIEKCDGNSILNGEKNDFTDEFEFTCDIEYKPTT